MNNPYNQNPENNEPMTEQNAANAQQAAQQEFPKAEPFENNAQAVNQEYSPQNRPYTQSAYNQQYTPNYSEQRQNAQYAQNGYQRPQYNGYYGNAGYYGQQTPQTPYQQANKPQMHAQKPEKKRASKGFVIGMMGIALAASFLLNVFTCGIMNLPSSGMSIFTPADVIIQYAPKNEAATPITDKGVSAYVASIAANSVVEVSTETVETDAYYGQYITEGAGSGVIISTSENGSYILTCAHVIDGAAKITVKLKDGTVYEADSYICDAESDVGVIKLNVNGLPAVTVGNFDEVVVGETVVAIGNPLGTLGGSVTNGIVSALDRDIIIDGTTYHLLQTNAEINPGNSGGGLFNAKGELIGIVNAKSVGENIEGLGFAIPVSDAIAIMTDLIEKGYVSGRVKLGFELFEIQNEEDIRNWFKYYRYFSDYGVYIASAENSNFQEGDLLVAIDGNKITSIADVKALLQEFEVGQTVTVTVSRYVGNKVKIFDYQLKLTEKMP
ncbi:MAG: trypsin-like peptidase domain-containing protein [Clostridia bacterium]|nr:trypsin-like peptidase domain-containing protein [Clostridia bacterium]